MEQFDIELTLKTVAKAYYSNDHSLAVYLLNGCLRRLSMFPLNVDQTTYLTEMIHILTNTVNRHDYTALADIIQFELLQNFPDFDSLLAQETQDSAQN